MPPRRWKVRGAATLAAATLAGSLVSCGDDNVNEPEQAPPTNTVDATSSTVDPTSTTVDPSPESPDSPAESPFDTPAGAVPPAPAPAPTRSAADPSPETPDSPAESPFDTP